MFCTSAPTEEIFQFTDLLKEVMNRLADFLVQKTKKPIRIFYVEEFSSLSANHLHYFIFTEHDSILDLRDWIKESLNKAPLEFDNDLQFFDETQKKEAVEYLHKGTFVGKKRTSEPSIEQTTISDDGLINNYEPKNSVLLKSGLITKGLRRSA